MKTNQQNNIYKKSLTKFIKEQDYNYFITLTTKKERTTRLVKIILDKFLLDIKKNIGYQNGFFVIEKKNRPHIHLLLKSKYSYKEISRILGVSQTTISKVKKMSELVTSPQRS